MLWYQQRLIFVVIIIVIIPLFKEITDEESLCNWSIGPYGEWPSGGPQNINFKSLTARLSAKTRLYSLIIGVNLSLILYMVLLRLSCGHLIQCSKPSSKDLMFLLRAATLIL